MLGHFFAIVQRLLKINDDIVREVNVEVTEMAREMMLVGLGVIPKAGEHQLAHLKLWDSNPLLALALRKNVTHLSVHSEIYIDI